MHPLSPKLTTCCFCSPEANLVLPWQTLTLCGPCIYFSQLSTLAATSPRTQTPTLQYLTTSNLLWGHQEFLFHSHRLLQVPQSFLSCLSAESKDLYNTILNFQAFSIDFLFLWNLPFKFTATRLFLGSAYIPFPLLLSITGHWTESHCKQDYLVIPPGLSLLLCVSPHPSL